MSETELTPARIEEIQALHEAAKKAEPYSRDYFDFIQAAGDAYPGLRALVERLRRERDEAREALAVEEERVRPRKVMTKGLVSGLVEERDAALKERDEARAEAGCHEKNHEGALVLLEKERA